VLVGNACGSHSFRSENAFFISPREIGFNVDERKRVVMREILVQPVVYGPVGALDIQIFYDKFEADSIFDSLTSQGVLKCVV
jgi:hypothetical protein